MRNFHRILSVIACGLLLYLGVTGSWIQILDLAEILKGAPESSPVMQSINEGKSGNFDYAVVSEGDYGASPLPADLDISRTFAGSLAALHKAAPAGGFTFVELRMAGDRPIGQARVGQMAHDPKSFGDGLVAVDARSGAQVAAVVAKPIFPPPSLRQSLKEWHRFWTRSDVPGVFFELLAGIVMWVLIVTGLVVYFRLLRQRRKMKRPQLFWKGGGKWRELHRMVSVGCAVLLVVVAFSGTWLGFESVWHVFQSRPGAKDTAVLGDAQVLRVADATVQTMRAREPGVAIKVIRVRDYAGMKQGVVVTDEPVTRQLVFNTATGAPVGLSEPGFPSSGFPLGLDVHEWMKHLHSGFLLGTWARVFDLIAGLALAFLSVSGLVMYVEMYRKRRRAGRKAFFWK